MHQVLPQPMLGVGVQGRKSNQFRIWLVVAGQKSEGNTLPYTNRRNLITTIGPIAPSTQNAQHHKLSVGDDVFDVQINGHVVRQVHQVGQAHAWKSIRRPPGTGLGQQGQFRIGGGNNDDITRCLTEIHGL